MNFKSIKSCWSCSQVFFTFRSLFGSSLKDYTAVREVCGLWAHILCFSKPECWYVKAVRDIFCVLWYFHYTVRKRGWLDYYRRRRFLFSGRQYCGHPGLCFFLLKDREYIWFWSGRPTVAPIFPCISRFVDKDIPYDLQVVLMKFSCLAPTKICELQIESVGKQRILLVKRGSKSS